MKIILLISGSIDKDDYFWRMIRLFLFITISLCLTTCGKKSTEPAPNPEPTACFSIDKKFVKPLELVNFNNCSENYERVEWTFGDGGSSVISDASYRYALVGNYTVKLKAFNGTKWHEQSSPITVANDFVIHLDATYSSSVIQNGDLVQSIAYVSAKNKSGSTLIGNGSGYHQNKNGLLQNSEFISNKTDTYTFKLLVNVYRGYKTQQSMLPDVLFASDSVVTEDINPITGLTNPLSVKALNTLTVTQNIYVTLK